MSSVRGVYCVKCYVFGKWRRVVVDDTIPLDLYGRPLLVTSTPLQVWPFLLSKAVFRLMELHKARSASWSCP